MSTVRYNVQGIACEGCAGAIKRALGSLSGVQSVDVSVPSKTVKVDYDADRLGVDEIKQRIEDAGYETAPSAE